MNVSYGNKSQQEWFSDFSLDTQCINTMIYFLNLVCISYPNIFALFFKSNSCWEGQGGEAVLKCKYGKWEIADHIKRKLHKVCAGDNTIANIFAKVIPEEIELRTTTEDTFPCCALMHFCIR